MCGHKSDDNEDLGGIVSHLSDKGNLADFSIKVP